MHDIFLCVLMLCMWYRSWPRTAWLYTWMLWYIIRYSTPSSLRPTFVMRVGAQGYWPRPCCEISWERTPSKTPWLARTSCLTNWRFFTLHAACMLILNVQWRTQCYTDRFYVCCCWVNICLFVATFISYFCFFICVLFVSKQSFTLSLLFSHNHFHYSLYLFLTTRISWIRLLIPGEWK